MVVRELITKLGFKLDKTGLDAAEKSVKGFKDKFGGQIKDLKGAIGSAMSGDIQGLLSMGAKALPIAAAALAAAGLFKVGQAAIAAASEVEDLQTQFEVMLGSAGDAAIFVDKIRSMAAATPFGTSDLARGAVTLKQFGVATEDVLPTLKMLGDVSGGNAQRLQSLSLVFGQIQSTGRLMGQDLLQLINVGFNPLQVISKQTGRSMADLKKDMEAGAISAEMVTAAFKSATSQGGMFFKGMEKASKTFSGLMSTMKDDWNAWLATIGKPMLEPLKNIVREVSKLLQSPAMRMLGDAISVVLTGLLYVGQAIVWVFTQTMKPLNRMISAFYFLRDLLMKMFSPIVKAVQKIFEPIQKAFRNMNRGAEDGLQIFERLGKFLEFLGDTLGTVFEFVGETIAGVITLTAPFFQWIADQIMAFASFIHDTWNTVFGAMINTVFQFVSTVAGLLNKIPGVKIDTKGLADMKKEVEAMVLFEKKVGKDAQSSSAKSTTLNVNNSFAFGGSAADTPAGAREAVKQAATAAFSIELKRLIVSTV